jgi:hypothetical protein
MKFTYTLPGWKESTTDAHMYNDVLTTDLHIPEDKSLLAETGHPHHDKLLVPY